MLGVRKLRPARPSLLKARASVDMRLSTSYMRLILNVAARLIGIGKEVASGKSPPNDTPHEYAIP
jgi:hypothetical protein